MSAQMTEAMKSAKTIQAEMTQWENRLDVLRSDHERLSKAKDALQADIDRKTSDYEVFIAARNSDIAKLREETDNQAKELARQKEEFKTILSNFHKEKQAFEAQNHSLAGERASLEKRNAAVNDFIIAVQRALTVLGL